MTSYGHAEDTLRNYENAVDRFKNFIFNRFQINLDTAPLPFTEIHLWFYFAFSGSYRNYNKGVLLSTMQNDIFAFRKYHKDHNSYLPIIRYPALEELLRGYKNIQKHRTSKAKYHISYHEVKEILTHLLNTGKYEDLVFALAFAQAWLAAMRTGEWDIKDMKRLHTINTLYFSSVTRPFPKTTEYILDIKTSKNWRCGVSTSFTTTGNVFSSPDILNEIINKVIFVNDIHVPPGVDPISCIPKKALLLNLNPDFTIVKPITRARVTAKLDDLVTKLNFDNKLHGYSFRRGFATWAFSQGCPPKLIQIFGRWRSDAYRRYIDYSKADLAQLSLCAAKVLPFDQANLA